ncbi:hypothetical protein VPH35_028613 [Triticum aestivum]
MRPSLPGARGPSFPPIVPPAPRGGRCDLLSPALEIPSFPSAAPPVPRGTRALPLIHGSIHPPCPMESTGIAPSRAAPGERKRRGRCAGGRERVTGCRRPARTKSGVTSRSMAAQSAPGSVEGHAKVVDLLLDRDPEAVVEDQWGSTCMLQ